MKNIYTQGVIAQKEFFKPLLSKSYLKNEDMRKLIELAQQLNQEVVVLAGRFTAQKGCFGIAADEDQARLFVATANNRMAEQGSTHTHWLVMGDKNFQDIFAHEMVHHAEVSGGKSRKVEL